MDGRLLIACLVFSFSANGALPECVVKLSNLTVSADLNTKIKAFLKMLYEQGYLNKEVLSDIKNSKSYYDFVVSANNRGLFKSQSTFVIFHRTLLSWEKQLDHKNWTELKEFAKELLLEKQEKENKVENTKKQTAPMIMGKVINRIKVPGHDSTPVTLFEADGKILGLVGSADFPVVVFDFFSGKILKEISNTEGVTSEIKFVLDQGRRKAIFISEKSRQIYFSDITDLNKIKTLKMDTGYGMKRALPFEHEGESYVIVYDLMNQDIPRAELFNISKGEKYKNAHVLSFPKSNTNFSFVKIGSEPFYAYGDELGVFKLYHALTGKPAASFKVTSHPILNFEIQKTDMGPVAFILDREGNFYLVNLETQKTLAKVEDFAGLATLGTGAEFFEHEGKRFITIFTNNRNTYEFPSMEFFKSSKQNEELNRGWEKWTFNKSFQFQNKSYFVYLVEGKGMIVNALTEETIVKFNLPQNANSIQIKDLGHEVIASVSTRDEGIVNIVLVGKP